MSRTKRQIAIVTALHCALPSLPYGSRPCLFEKNTQNVPSGEFSRGKLTAMLSTLRKLVHGSPQPDFAALCERQPDGTFLIRCKKCGEELTSCITERGVNYAAGVLAKHQCLDKGPIEVFHCDDYLRVNARQLEHLTTLGISVRKMSVLEVGAGIGDHTHYFLDRDCNVTITEGRGANIAILRTRYPEQRVVRLDFGSPLSDRRFSL